MDALSEKYLHYKTTTFEEVAGKGAKQVSFNQVSLEVAAPYAAEDAEVTLRLHNFFWPELTKTPSLMDVFQTIEMPLMPVLSRMERYGVLIDCDKLHAQSKAFQIRLLELEQEAYTLAGEEFNLNSPKQLQEILFVKLNHPILEKTPTGQASTAESTLHELALSYPLPKLILEYRTIAKLKSTYTDSLPLQMNAKTGRIHTSYQQAVTSTGRLSSTEPNLQNIPIKTEAGRKIRSAFIAPPGKKILSADYSQIELRIMAHLSQDPTLLQVFANGEDVHQSTAAEIFNVPLSEVTQEQRRSAKAVNFGLIYGMSAFGLAKQLGVSRGEADSYIQAYFKRFAGVKNFMDDIRKLGVAQGFVETIYGRRIYFPDLQSKVSMKQKAAERAAINAPMQGSQADIIKKAMIEIDAWLQDAEPKVVMIMQVHDELIFEVPAHKVDMISEKIKTIMTSCATLSIPLVVDVGVGDNWNEAH